MYIALYFKLFILIIENKNKKFVKFKYFLIIHAKQFLFTSIYRIKQNLF